MATPHDDLESTLDPTPHDLPRALDRSLPRGAHTAAAPPSDLVRSVSRALAVLEVVGASGGSVSVKAAARRTGLNLSTAYHLMRTLTWEGYLVRLSNGDYRLGAGVAHRYRELRTALAAPPPVRRDLHRLVAATGWTVFLGRPVEGEPCLADVVEGPAVPALPALTPGSPQAVAATPLARLLGSGDTPASASGPVVEDGRLHPALSCGAVALRSDPGGPPAWALGLVAPRGGLDPGSPGLGALVRAGERLSRVCRAAEEEASSPPPA